jgi:serine/threonine protein kinase
MFDAQGHIKIIDLGMCILAPISKEGDFSIIPHQGICGKKLYMAPEIFISSQPFNAAKADIWALGIALFIMLTGAPPFDDEDFKSYMHFVSTLEDGLLTSMVAFRRLSSSAVELISRILRPNPSERLSLIDILAHPWITESSVGSINPAAPLLIPRVSDMPTAC